MDTGDLDRRAVVAPLRLGVRLRPISHQPNQKDDFSLQTSNSRPASMADLQLPLALGAFLYQLNHEILSPLSLLLRSMSRKASLKITKIS